MFSTGHFPANFHIHIMAYSVFSESRGILTCLSNTTIFTHITWSNHSDKIWYFLLCIQKPLLEIYLNVSNNRALKLEHKLVSSLNHDKAYHQTATEFFLDWHLLNQIMGIWCYLTACHGENPPWAISIITEWTDGWLDKAAVSKMHVHGINENLWFEQEIFPSIDL